MIDALCHLDFQALDADRGAVVARARAAGVTGWVVAGTDPATWDRTAATAGASGGVAALGLHPWWAADVDLGPALDDLAARRPAAVGEIGLDRLAPGWDRQIGALRGQLAVARALDVPVILHVVRCWPEVKGILARDGLPARGGYVHGWSAPLAAVEEAEALGLLVSIGPGVLRPGRARRAAERVSLRALLIETDSPDQRPPGEARGELAHLAVVAAAVAAARCVAVDVIAQASRDNAVRLFPDREATWRGS
jgi:TatD DNase family protein